MGNDFILSEKICNIIINKIDLNKYTTIGELEIRGKETLEWRDGFFKEDVKEFIKKLKEEICKGHTEVGFEAILDKLAGNKLT